MISGSAIGFSSSLGVLLRRCRGSFLLFRVELAQPRHNLFPEQCYVRDRIGVIEKAALAEEQQMAKAADPVVERLDLVVDVIGRPGKTGGALHQLLEGRGGVFDRVAVAVADKPAALTAG